MAYPYYKCPACNGWVRTFRTETRQSSEYGDDTYDICPLCGEETHMIKLKRCPVCAGKHPSYDDGWMEPGERMCDSCKRHWKWFFQAIIEDAPKPAQDYLDDLLDGVTIKEFLCDR